MPRLLWNVASKPFVKNVFIDIWPKAAASAHSAKYAFRRIAYMQIIDCASDSFQNTAQVHIPNAQESHDQKGFPFR